ncbi:MAG: acetolactate synthase small subunit [Lachnospiraceae bacterium]|jgi:acetolactate synthase-1/3 small subunit|nr:acetolactate synthase small subunit [Lachnospiraceae bacterium]
MEMTKRWVSLYVENQVGVLAKISGLFSGKSYNMQSLTVGETEDPTVSRMTIGMLSDDITFEQIKKQLNRCVEVIKVVDFTVAETRMREILFIKVGGCSLADKEEIFRIAQVFKLDVVDYRGNTLLVECIKSEDDNNEVVELFNRAFPSRIEVVRGGNVAIERA